MVGFIVRRPHTGSGSAVDLGDSWRTSYVQLASPVGSTCQHVRMVCRLRRLTVLLCVKALQSNLIPRPRGAVRALCVWLADPALVFAADGKDNLTTRAYQPRGRIVGQLRKVSRLTFLGERSRLRLVGIVCELLGEVLVSSDACETQGKRAELLHHTSVQHSRVRTSALRRSPETWSRLGWSR